MSAGPGEARTTLVCLLRAEDIGHRVAMADGQVTGELKRIGATMGDLVHLGIRTNPSDTGLLEWWFHIDTEVTVDPEEA